MSILYSVPTNFEPDLVPALTGLPVGDLYGQLPRDLVGGGRASFLFPEVTRRRVREHVAEAHRAGFRFQYTLNAPSLANREWSLAGQHQLAELVDFLVDAEVDGVTVCIPYLVPYLKRHAPRLRIMVSTQAWVDSPDRARRWQDLGADGITLSFLHVQRDFRALRAIRAAVTLDLQLITNLLCLQGCPAGHYHGVLNGHASQTGMSPCMVDWCVIDCIRRRLADPTEIIRAGWIRPEDQQVYGDLGIHHFKLVNRGMRTRTVASIVRAYAERRSPPDLMDLFPSTSESLIHDRPVLRHMIRHFGHPLRLNLFRMRKFKAMTDARHVHLDSSQLDGFLDWFLEGRCDNIDCQACGYCAQVARRAVRVDPEYATRALADHDAMLDDLESGRLFSYLG